MREWRGGKSRVDLGWRKGGRKMWGNGKCRKRQSPEKVARCSIELQPSLCQRNYF